MSAREADLSPKLVEAVAREVFIDVVTEGRRALVQHILTAALPLLEKQVAEKVLRELRESVSDILRVDGERMGARFVIKCYADEHALDLTQHSQEGKS